MTAYSMTPEVYELKTYAVVCQLCQIADIDTEKNLRADGWLLTKEAEICGDCIKRMEFYEIGQHSKRIENEFRNGFGNGEAINGMVDQVA